ncbi:xanthine dehydrogenase family protein molybdopterin-binding subunit [Methylophilus sp. 13]|uniref:xanthine dehydrogenase family protein molybdopterin-binding subunit n=1 Tax=Methylophilus sp. 13 TaxID=2781018 RepID=UPI001890A196|nr:xanthine dehydrogenase family protein molybdopterin-binding subunit [Methylophilus sp. 13]MBF5040463.1 xanthine dehydrogenase family protein molybdopterin-binding subunit [Methylophilus sp. 13]
MSQGLIQGLADKYTVSNPPRRDFLKIAATVSATTAGGMLLSISLPALGQSKQTQPYSELETGKDVLAPNGFIKIDTKGEVTMIMPKVEMGQGVYTSIPMLLAEELEVDLPSVKLEHAPPNEKLYADALLGAQVTGGSTSIRALWEPMRQAGAVCRSLLIAAAAQQWKVAESSCYAKSGVVYHDASGRELGYGELVKVASTLPVPKQVALKDPKDFKLIGTAAKRLDTPDKVNGLAKFGIDAHPDNVKFAVIATSPVFGGTLASVDDSRALKMPGVLQVVKVDNAVAVIARNTWAAKRGLGALDIQWNEGNSTAVKTSDLVNDLREASKKPGAVAKKQGNATSAYKKADKTLSVEYEQPFLAHATMEPMNCTVEVSASGCDLWVGTQIPTFAQGMAAKTLNIPVEKVRLHNFLIGGGFGRRLEFDGVVQAVKIAKLVKGPVKVIWTREEDIQHDMFRPYYFDRISAGLDANGKPVAWSHRIVGSSIMARFAPPLVKNGVDPDAVEVSAEPPYDLPNLYVDYVRVEPRDVPTAFWRGVGPTRGTFVVESFIDELAHLAKVDPVKYRLDLLGKTPRLKNALQLAVSKSDWGKPLAKGQGRGVSVMHAFGSFLAMVVDVTVNDQGEVKVDRVVSAVDCGMTVNPDTVIAQIQGGVIFGLTAVLYNEITIEHGRVQQTNFNDYRMLRINEAPAIDVHLIKSAEAPGGIGEPGTAAIGAALANAVFSATGKRIRKLPIGHQLKA